MVEYGVNVANKFGFLSDDEVDDPEVVLKRAEAANKKDEKSASQKKADRNAAARKKKETAAAAALTAATREAEAKKAAVVGGGMPKRAAEANKENRVDGERGRGRGRGGRGGPGRGRGGNFAADGARVTFEQGGDTLGDRFGENRGRGGRGRGGGRGGPRPPFRGGRGGGAPHPVEGGETELHNAEDNHQTLVNGEQQHIDTNGGMGMGGRGGFRGGRGGYRGGDGERPMFRGGRGGRGGGRQFDRMSGSDRVGVKPVEKKEGYGKGNWGTEQDETNAGDNDNTVVNIEGEKVEEPVVPREKTEEELRMEAEAEALAKQLTLDEFKAQMAGKRAEPQFNIRKAGEGANDKEFGKLVPLAKQNIADAPEEEILVVRREPRTKRLDIEINFTDEQRGGRGGGRGRGEFRGGRGARGGRGEGRGPRQSNQNFEVSADAFPALGAV